VLSFWWGESRGRTTAASAAVVLACLVAGVVAAGASASTVIQYCFNGTTDPPSSLACWGLTMDPAAEWNTSAVVYRDYNKVAWQRTVQMRVRYQRADGTYLSPAVVGSSSPLIDGRSGDFKSLCSNQGANWADYVDCETTKT
jgi:hypothetical protein